MEYSHEQIAVVAAIGGGVVFLCHLVLLGAVIWASTTRPSRGWRWLILWISIRLLHHVLIPLLPFAINRFGAGGGAGHYMLLLQYVNVAMSFAEVLPIVGVVLLARDFSRERVP